LVDFFPPYGLNFLAELSSFPLSFPQELADDGQDFPFGSFPERGQVLVGASDPLFFCAAICCPGVTVFTVPPPGFCFLTR